MKEKIKRILDLVRSGKLSLDDAAPLLAALHAKLALQSTDRELLDSLLKREDLDTAQVAEHLMLLRGLKDTPPSPPQPPRPPRKPEVIIGGRRMGGLDDLGDRIAAKIEQMAEQFAGKAEKWGETVEERAERFAADVERSVEEAFEGKKSKPSYAYNYEKNPSTRILNIYVESSDGDEYTANLPVSLAPHLHKLIPPHGLRALEKAGFSIETLQLLIEANPPKGDLIHAEDSDGNEVQITIQ